MSASYTQTTTDFKAEKTEYTFCSRKNKHTRVYISVQCHFHLICISHTQKHMHAHTAARSYTFNLYSHDDTQHFESRKRKDAVEIYLAMQTTQNQRYLVLWYSSSVYICNSRM